VRFDAELGSAASGLPGFCPFLSDSVAQMKTTWPKAVEVLAAGGTSTEAAKAAQVTVRTIRRWRNDEVLFADAVDDARASMLTEAAGLLAAATTTAARRLAEIVQSEEERHSLTAARIVLEQASKYRIDRAIEDRIAALEVAVSLRSGWQ